MVRLIIPPPRVRQSARTALQGWLALRLLLAFLCGSAPAQEGHEPLDPVKLKRLPLDQLLETEITSVSRRVEPLKRAPSAIDVVTDEDIRRTGANNLQDALRLATGLHVAQVDGHDWAISARGFNTTTSNKMQVLMDGRNLYTPLYSGVFWDVQHTFMPDVEQIEVIRGPGATLWGANAVNGVINIRSKSARDTQGWLLQGGAGNVEQGFGGVRYGGKIGDTFYRVYATTLNRADMSRERGGNARDAYSLTQAGFRTDTDLSAGDLLTFQGDMYTGRFGQLVANDVEASGGNLLARWTRTLSADSSLMLQGYYDRTHRLVPGTFEEVRNNYDLEFQHSFTVNDAHDIVWGLNFRASQDEISNLGPGLAFLPAAETLYLISGYIQDDFHVIPNLLTVTLGTKLEHNSFSGFEYQPSLRFALTPTPNQTFWGAVSRSVRTPSRIDQDLFAPNPAFAAPTTLQGTRAYQSEVLLAYELGYRARPLSNVTTDLALFYHDFSHVRSIEPIGAGPTLTFGNLLEGEVYGAEFEAKWQATRWWRVEGGYTVMRTHLRTDAGSRDTRGGTVEGNDPNNIFVLRSLWDLPGDFELDATFRYVGALPRPQTPAYSTLDLRLGWEPKPGLELAIVGRNLLDAKHPEYRTTTVSREVGRSVYFMFTCRF
ncbi:TonB-dependent receptor [Prosthecobacter sp.]|uniref:TonB-dependent receptor plug domain-containing protein n=1 Tax=Prosthecobacter sp. TaxID=1965333 RepID=UPI002ABC653D|nr:TonB-dependent receptor [Prosthecobacter sp.]MDZ4401165.1 TonB-dependent receptor [Prosthecobacter sp.]